VGGKYGFRISPKVIVLKMAVVIFAQKLENLQNSVQLTGKAKIMRVR
jgi:hypothetical protein